MTGTATTPSRLRLRRSPDRPQSAYPTLFERVRAFLGLGVLSIVIALLITIAIGVVAGGLVMLVDFAISR